MANITKEIRDIVNRNGDFSIFKPHSFIVSFRGTIYIKPNYLHQVNDLKTNIQIDRYPTYINSVYCTIDSLNGFNRTFLSEYVHNSIGYIKSSNGATIYGYYGIGEIKNMLKILSSYFMKEYMYHYHEVIS